MQASGRKIRVLVVDDSAVMRKLISNCLEKDPEIEVVATAIDGDFALSKVDQLKPDVVTLDVDMPRMDGITALGHIVAKHDIPVVMLSSLTARGAALTMRALEKGAVDFICKPGASSQIGEMADELVSKIKGASRGKIVAANNRALDRRVLKKRPAGVSCGARAQRVVAIGASSGGPHALRYLLPRIPADLNACLLIVQHMPESFTSMLARWLDEICEIEVREASEGDLIVPGKALIAPACTHMKVSRGRSGCEVTLERGSVVNGHMPSVDVLFRSIAAEYGAQATGVIMTGMGSDGAQGIGEIKKAGGWTLAQNKESCSVFGMPRVAIEKGFVNEVVPLTEMASRLTTAVGRVTPLEECHASSR
ncbi:MAG TPA: chemotaxis response regulator protein-glutamate methylesterase [Blastocatellia bacterium]|nr:chemotaxis response regulator protein-glutamate methylesterase [Blastocatellia bacterium]